MGCTLKWTIRSIVNLPHTLYVNQQAIAFIKFWSFQTHFWVWKILFSCNHFCNFCSGQSYQHTYQLRYSELYIYSVPLRKLWIRLDAAKQMYSPLILSYPPPLLFFFLIKKIFHAVIPHTHIHRAVMGQPISDLTRFQLQLYFWHRLLG